MLAAQLLYPGARICLHGGVNRNVREFYNLHAEQIPSVEPSARRSRLACGTLVLVEVSEPARLGEFAELARRDGVEVSSFDHHGEAELEQATAFIATDGSLVTEHAEAAARARHPDHADAGDGVRARHPRGHRLADVFLDHAARRRGARRLHARRRQPGAARRATCAGRSQPEQRELLRRLDAAREQREVAGLRVVTAAAQRGRATSRTSRRSSRASATSPTGTCSCCAVEMEGRVLVVGAQPHLRAGGRRGARARSAAAVTRRRPRRSCASGDPERGARAGARGDRAGREAAAAGAAT